MTILEILNLVHSQKLTPEQGLELITNGVESINKSPEKKSIFSFKKDEQ